MQLGEVTRWRWNNEKTPEKNNPNLLLEWTAKVTGEPKEFPSAEQMQGVYADNDDSHDDPRYPDSSIPSFLF
jgi:hypothetical protein